MSLICAIAAVLLWPAWFSGQQLATKSALMLEDGTPIRLRLKANVSSSDARVGDKVDFEVLEDIKVGDLTVISKHLPAWGTVTEAQPKKLLSGGKLNVCIDYVQLSNGEKAALRANRQVRNTVQSGAVNSDTSGNNKGPFDPIIHMLYGKEITVPKGTEITVYVSGDYTIARSQFEATRTASTAAPNPPVPAKAEEQAAGVSVLVSSTPAGADIELDGSFVGSTPSIITMPAGDHTIVIRKKAFNRWERKIKAMMGSIKVEAELEPER